MPDSAAPNILDKSYTITAEVTVPDGGAEGMIVTEGGRFGGYGLFLSKGDFGVGRGKAVFLYNLQEDPTQFNDLAAKMPEKVKEMQALSLIHISEPTRPY